MYNSVQDQNIKNQGNAWVQSLSNKVLCVQRQDRECMDAPASKHNKTEVRERHGRNPATQNTEAGERVRSSSAGMFSVVLERPQPDWWSIFRICSLKRQPLSNALSRTHPEMLSPVKLTYKINCPRQLHSQKMRAPSGVVAKVRWSFCLNPSAHLHAPVVHPTLHRFPPCPTVHTSTCCPICPAPTHPSIHPVKSLLRSDKGKPFRFWSHFSWFLSTKRSLYNNMSVNPLSHLAFLFPDCDSPWRVLLFCAIWMAYAWLINVANQNNPHFNTDRSTSQALWCPFLEYNKETIVGNYPFTNSRDICSGRDGYIKSNSTAGMGERF